MQRDECRCWPREAGWTQGAEGVSSGLELGRGFHVSCTDRADHQEYTRLYLAKHSRTLVQNDYFNGHPDLVVRGHYTKNSVKAGSQGVEIKTTRKVGGAVDTHGAREQWMCVFVYEIDNQTEPAVERAPLTFTEIYLGHVKVTDFRKNARGELGTRTATLDAQGIAKLRESWVYRG